MYEKLSLLILPFNRYENCRTQLKQQITSLKRQKRIGGQIWPKFFLEFLVSLIFLIFNF